MKRVHLDEIKGLESSPKKVNIFSEKEIKMIRKLYDDLPEKVYNKKQNIRKKAWIKNYNKDLDKIYFNKIKDVLGDYKMDNLKSENGEDYYGLFHESFSPLPIHVDSGFHAEDIIYKELKEADIEWGGKYNSRPDGDKRLAGIVRDACKKVR